MIKLSQVTKTYGSGPTAVTALHPTDLQVEKGEIFGQMPGHSVVDADAAIVGAGGNQGDFLHNRLSLGFQTASYTKYNSKPTSPTLPCYCEIKNRQG